MLYLILIFSAVFMFGLVVHLRVRQATIRNSVKCTNPGMTGAQAALVVLRAARLDKTVAIERADGILSDHYYPNKKTLRLSPEVYDEQSLTAMGIAFHEAGHALQDAQNYGPLKFHHVFVSTASVGSTLGILLILLGLILQTAALALAGLILFCVVMAFQIINLAIERDASRRASVIIRQAGIISDADESRKLSTVLNAAAMTYIAATVTAMVYLIYHAWTAVNSTWRYNPGVWMRELRKAAQINRNR